MYTDRNKEIIATSMNPMEIASNCIQSYDHVECSIYFTVFEKFTCNFRSKASCDPTPSNLSLDTLCYNTLESYILYKTVTSYFQACFCS